MRTPASNDAASVDVLLREQWSGLRSWLDLVDVRAYGDLHSVLYGWTVRELVAHVGYGIELLTGVEAAAPGVDPLPIGEYVAQYRPAAHEIQQATNAVAAAMPDVLDGIDALAAAAWPALDALEAPVVIARRGPLTRRDYLVTRLLELVVHADDLHRSLPCAIESPVHAESRQVVAEALADAYRAKSGRAPDVADAARWVRLATGRAVSHDPHLPLL